MLDDGIRKCDIKRVVAEGELGCIADYGCEAIILNRAIIQDVQQSDGKVRTIRAFRRPCLLRSTYIQHAGLCRGGEGRKEAIHAPSPEADEHETI